MLSKEHAIRHQPSKAIQRLLTALAVSAAFLVPIVGDRAEACASSHGRPFLAAFTGPTDGQANLGSRFYAATEGNAAVATIRVTPGHCVPQEGSTARYGTQDGSATGGVDYTAIAPPVESQALCADVDQQESFCPGFALPQRTVSLSTAPDSGGTDAAVETFLFKLSNGQPFGLGLPTSAPVHIVDTDGNNRITLEPTLNGTSPVQYEREEFQFILIPIFWAGPGPTGSVNFTVEGDGANPATHGEDYTCDPACLPGSGGSLPVGSGRVAFLRINIIGDKLVEPDETVRITLQDAPGYVLAEQTETTFTIRDNDGNIPLPTSRFHHPRDKRKYNFGAYQIREMHTYFDQKPGGSQVVAAQIALRRKKAGGQCAWWGGGRFRPGKCGAKKWLNMGFDGSVPLFFYRIKPLKPTNGTKIKNYRAWTRVIDGADNVESIFNRGRNLSTFFVRKR